MDYELIRSDRKTIGATIRQNRLIVRAPQRATEKEIERFLLRHQKWIETHLEQAQAREEEKKAIRKLTQEEVRALADRARDVIPKRVAYYAPRVGVSYGNITVRRQHSRWGSCSSKGNLNFNCLLMLMPPEVVDSVVVHELCHRKEMNHSPRFYAEVLRVFPDYRTQEKWLKENGPKFMAMLGD